MSSQQAPLIDYQPAQPGRRVVWGLPRRRYVLAIIALFGAAVFSLVNDHWTTRRRLVQRMAVQNQLSLQRSAQAAARQQQHEAYWWHLAVRPPAGAEHVFLIDPYQPDERIQEQIRAALSPLLVLPLPQTGEVDQGTFRVWHDDVKFFRYTTPDGTSASGTVGARFSAGTYHVIADVDYPYWKVGTKVEVEGKLVPGFVDAKTDPAPLAEAISKRLLVLMLSDLDRVDSIVNAPAQRSQAK